MSNGAGFRSVRTLFEWHRDTTDLLDVERRPISVSDQLDKHADGRDIGLRAASERFVEPVDGDGFARGCRVPDHWSETDLMTTIPSWVSVDDQETRRVEGVLEESKITYTDFPLAPWHYYYDWIFNVKVDPQFYELYSEHPESAGSEPDPDDHLHCEWDTSGFPRWAWPHEGDRIVLIGRWIYDCGHPDDGRHYTEIHPPKAMVGMRNEATQLDGDDQPTRATRATFYAGRDGGYWTHDIDEDVSFKIPLPPQPYDDASPTWTVDSKTGSLPVQPRVDPFPADDPAMLDVVVPLDGVSSQPNEYGFVLYGGWTDPHDTQGIEVASVRVETHTLHLESDMDYGPDAWHFYVGINGRWKVWTGLGGWEESLDFEVDLDIHQDDEIRVTACGFDPDATFDIMGDPLMNATMNDTYSWEDIRTASDDEAEVIHDLILRQVAQTLNNRNEKIAYGTKTVSNTLGSFEVDTSDYTLEFTVNTR